MKQDNEIKIGDRLKAIDGSGTFIVKEFTRIGAIGDIIFSDGRVSEGYATYSQLENDYSKPSFGATQIDSPNKP